MGENQNRRRTAPTVETPLYEVITRRIDRLYQARIRYAGNVVFIVLFVAGLHVFFVRNVTDWSLIQPQMHLIYALLFGLFCWLTLKLALIELRERAIRRELDRAGYDLDYAEKTKRDERLVRLGDDGELEAVYPEDEVDYREDVQAKY